MDGGWSSCARRRSCASPTASAAAISTSRPQIESNGTRFDLVTPDCEIPIWSPLLGRVNVYNMLAAAAAAYERGVEPVAIGAAAALPRVPGRFESVDAGQPFTVVVDYAHTDDALRNLTALARDSWRNAVAAGASSPSSAAAATATAASAR